MAHAVVMHESLTGAELSLVYGLREIPGGVARDELIRLIEHLVSFVRDPRCPRAQADGVPCPSIGTACEQCQCVAETLAGLRRSLHHAY
jgi:hypothetical protein